MPETVEENQCPKCLKILSNKYKLTAHLNKKIPCQSKKKNEFKCERCQKIFSSKQRLNSHKDKKIKCTPILSNEVIIEKEKTKQEIEKTKQEQLRLARVEKEFRLLKIKGTKDPSIYIDTLNVNIQNNNIISFDKINTIPTKEELATVLNYENPKDAAMYIFESIFANPERPQNKCIIYPNKAKDEILLLKDNEWKLQNLENEKDVIFLKARDLYLQKVKECRHSIKELFEITEEEFIDSKLLEEYGSFNHFCASRQSANIGCNNITLKEIKEKMLSHMDILEKLII